MIIKEMTLTKRLYNYPWMKSFFYLEQYTLWGKQDMLEWACQD